MGLTRFVFACCFLLIGNAFAQYSYTLFNAANLAGTTNLNLMNRTSPTFFIIHGWMQSGTQPWVKSMTNAYLTNITSANVVVFNWAPYSLDRNYFVSAVGVVPAGQALGAKIASLLPTQITIATTQLIGFCLGAHVAGIAAQVYKTQKNALLAVIIGLDAPILTFPIDSGRLSIDDAKFVQIFHTNGFGRTDAYGHVDVYFNYEVAGWGLFQPNCPFNSNVNPPLGTDIVLLSACDHVRSIAYWIESISTNQFLGVKCTCWVNQVNKCGNVSVPIGHYMNSALTGKYCLKTNNFPPFGKGPLGIV